MSHFESIISDLQAEIGPLKADEIQEYCKDKSGRLKLLQWKLVSNVTKNDVYTDEIGQAIDWLMQEKEILEILLFSGDIIDSNWIEAVSILKQIIDSDPNARAEGQRLKLAISIALTFSNPVKSEAYADDFIDGLARYRTFVSWMRNREFFPVFYDLTAWHLRFVVGSWATDEELQWARNALWDDFKSSETIGDASYKMIKYNAENEKGISAQDRDRYYDYQPVTMKKVFEVGSVYGGMSKFGAHMAHAFGVPAFPVEQPGHCALLWWKNGQWV